MDHLYCYTNLDMERVKTPEINKYDDIAPEVSKHFCNHTQSSGKWAGKSVLVFINDYKTKK